MLMIKTYQSGDSSCSTRAPLGTSAGCSPRTTRTTPRASCHSHFLCFDFFCVTHFHFSIWICFPLLSELDLVKQSHFLFWIRRIFTAVFFLFHCHSLVHNAHFFFFLFTSSACSAPISRTQHCLLRSPKLLFDLPPPRRCRPSSLQKQTLALCNGFMIQPWPVPLFHMCTSGNIWGILIQMLYKGVSCNCCHTGFFNSINMFACLFGGRSGNNVEQFPMCLWMLPVQWRPFGF